MSSLEAYSSSLVRNGSQSLSVLSVLELSPLEPVCCFGCCVDWVGVSPSLSVGDGVGDGSVPPIVPINRGVPPSPSDMSVSLSFLASPGFGSSSVSLRPASLGSSGFGLTLRHSVDPILRSR